MRWSKGLLVGLSGTSLALAVGCSHGDAKPEAGEYGETTAWESKAADATGADEKADDARPGWAKKNDGDRAQDPEPRSSPTPTVANTDPGGQSPWFLRPPGSPDPNAPRPVTTVSDVKVESPKPIVGVAQPPPPRPNPPPGGWHRAACGRG